MYEMKILEYNQQVQKMFVKTNITIFNRTNMILVSLILLTIFFKPFSIFFLIILILNLIITFFSVTNESMLVIKGKGIQIERVFYNSSIEYHFIPISNIETFILNEGFQNRRVIYYLCIILKNQKKLILPFSHTIPRLKDCLIILKKTRKILFE